MAIPSPKVNWIIRNKWWMIDGFTALSVAVGVLIGSMKLRKEIAEVNRQIDVALATPGGPTDPIVMGSTGSWIFIIGGAFGALAQIGKAIVSKHEGSKEAKREHPEDLYGCCHVLRELVMRKEDDQFDESLRITIYRVIREAGNEPKELEQVIPYAGPLGHIGGEPGRIFPASCGIIGQVARTKAAQTFQRTTSDNLEFHNEVVAQWGYSEVQAKALDPTRWAWMGVPLFDVNKHVSAVVYLDSCHPEAFDDVHSMRVVKGCEALRRFANERYGG